jgi:plasmid stabilization system protein ParE
MTMQSQLTDDETTLLIRAAVMAGMTVAVSKWSGKTGTLAEFEVIGKGLRDAARTYPNNPILAVLESDANKKALADMVNQFQTDAPMNLQDVKPFALRRCDELAEMLTAKASPEQADEVKQAIVVMCQRIAEESKEGDFLGFGGKRVSPEETAVIGEVARALKTTLPA